MKKKLSVLSLMVVMSLVLAQSAFAVGVADAGVVSGFTAGTDGIVATLVAVAPIVVPIMVALLGWKYGRKIFNQIAK